MTGAEFAQMELLSLAECLERLAKRLRESTYSSSVWRPVYSALCSGTLVAIGDIVTREGRVTEQDIQIIRDLWKLVAESEFREAAYRQRVIIFPLDAPSDRQLFVCRVRVPENDFEAWVADKFEGVGAVTLAKEPGGKTPATHAEGPSSTALTLSEGAGDAATKTGQLGRYPGRPSIKSAILTKLHERAAAKLLSDTLAAEARWLLDWAHKTFFGEPGLPSTSKVVENQIRDEYRKFHLISRPGKTPH
jgi:hypothetical protein